MSRQLPPLNAVRVFVAAARHQSFSRAAVELHVTHGAVSRQIQRLEAHLGVALFERRVRQVALTPQGQAFYAQADAGLAQIEQAANLLKSRTPTRTVRINVRPSFAVRWLIPRLPDFISQHPDIEPHVSTGTAPPCEAAEAFDIAIRRGLQGWPASMQVTPFLEDEAVAVASPALLRSHGLAIDSPRDLADHVLLGARSRQGDWDDWLKRNGVRRFRSAGRLHLDHLHLVLQAAIDGLGIAIAPRSLLGNDLREHRLAQVLPTHRLPLDRYYYAIAEESSEVRAFIQWIEGIHSAEP